MEEKSKTLNIKKVLFTIMFWFLSLTWGALQSYIGLIILAVLSLFGCKIRLNGCSFIVEVGGNWGGLELGCVAICGHYLESNPDYYEHIRRHEFGHNLQQLIFGPFQIFLIFIPSAIRYWYRELKDRLKIKEEYAYDDIWFEYTASKYGYKFINWLEDKDLPYTHIRKKKEKKNVKTYIYYRDK